MNWVHFAHPWLLWLLPLAALPLFGQPGRPLANSWLLMQSRDRLSRVLGSMLRVAGVLALAALVAAMAGPYRPEVDVERVGKGAEIVLLLDRSRSMDQGFAGARARVRPGARPGTGPEAIDYYAAQSPARLRESKGKVARELLADFAAKRPDDRFGMIVFSTLPIRVLEFTQKQPAIQAAIAAGNIGRGLSETNIGLALQAALSSFEGRLYTGSRIVMLVSDGGDQLDTFAKERIAWLARRERVGLYWIYLRSANSPGLTLAPGEVPASNPGAADAIPEVALNRYFESLPTSYHAYEAGDAEALKQAIEAVNRLENLPITYHDTLPRRDMSPFALGLALGCVLLLLAAQLVEIRRWA